MILIVLLQHICRILLNPLVQAKKAHVQYVLTYRSGVGILYSLVIIKGIAFLEEYLISLCS